MRNKYYDFSRIVGFILVRMAVLRKFYDLCAKGKAITEANIDWAIQYWTP